MIRTRSVSTEPTPEDGLRILVTRFRGRGLPKDRYHVWMANLGPSEALLRDVQSGKITWLEFKRRYKAELFESEGNDRRNQTIKNHGQKFTLRLLQELSRRGPVTLLCHCAENTHECHRFVLKEILEKKTIG